MQTQKEFYPIGEFARLIGKHVSTLRVWEKSGELIPQHKSKGGKRYYSHAQLIQYLSLQPKHQQPKKIIGYCRVSSKKQQSDLERQIDNVKTYCIAKGYAFEIIQDIGSGINYKKQGLQQLIKQILLGQVEKVVVLYKDRLLRFGFELLETICEIHNVNIEIIDNSTQQSESTEQELTEDLIQIIQGYAYKLQGRRAKKTKELIEELKL